MSYSSSVKDELACLPVKGTCCRKAFLYGILYCADLHTDQNAPLSVRFPVPSGTSTDYAAWLGGMIRAQFGTPPDIQPETRGAHKYLHVSLHNKQAEKNLHAMSRVTEASEDAIPALLGFRCDACCEHFLRGIFLCAGTVNDPAKSYHLELRVPADGRADLLLAHLLGNGFTPSCTSRRGEVGYIWKSSNAIQDFLTYIGAMSNVFDLLNSQIERAIRNDENRATNCVTRNISRSMGAGAKQISAIRYLADANLLASLSPELQVTAELRMQHPEATLAELAALHEPPITKSGLNHRLEKIMAFYEKVKV